MPDRLKNGDKVVGVRQTLRALESGRVAAVFIAEGSDPRVTGPVALRAGELGVEVAAAASMQTLGTVCGIRVPAAVAALLLPDSVLAE